MARKPDSGSAEITSWCNSITNYKKDGSNSGDISTRVFREVVAGTPGTGHTFGPVGDNYVITLASGSAAGTYTITGID
jgi:predicted dienelactone hydrolase